jgi:hypothetical protein
MSSSAGYSLFDSQLPFWRIKNSVKTEWKRWIGRSRKDHSWKTMEQRGKTWNEWISVSSK